MTDWDWEKTLRTMERKMRVREERRRKRKYAPTSTGNHVRRRGQEMMNREDNTKRKRL